MSLTNRIHCVFSKAVAGGSANRTCGQVKASHVGVSAQPRRKAAQRGPLAGLSVCLSAFAAFVPATAHAQDPTTAPPPPAAEPPPPPAPPMPLPGVSPAQSETPPLATEAMPGTRTDKLPPIDVGAWVRVGGRIQGTNPKNLDGEQFDTVYGEIHAGGKVHKNVSLTLNLNASGVYGTAGIEDAIIGLDFQDEFHIWLGQELVPVDRANYGGPFFAIPWNYPGILAVGSTRIFATPAEGPGGYGRSAGAVVWGDVAGGMFKYSLGAFQPGPLTASPLFSGRLSIALVGQETGYFGNASYFGDKNIVALGLGGQYQNKGSTGANAPDTYGEVNGDALVEMKYGGGGWFTGDAAYYHYVGDNQQVRDSFYILGAIATPVIGVGNIQPMVRYQLVSGDTMPKAWSIDAFLGYLIKGPALRFTLGLSHTEMGNDVVGNALQLGAQAIFF